MDYQVILNYIGFVKARLVTDPTPVIEISISFPIEMNLTTRSLPSAVALCDYIRNYVPSEKPLIQIIEKGLINSAYQRARGYVCRECAIYWECESPHLGVDDPQYSNNFSIDEILPYDDFSLINLDHYKLSLESAAALLECAQDLEDDLNYEHSKTPFQI